VKCEPYANRWESLFSIVIFLSSFFVLYFGETVVHKF